MRGIVSMRKVLFILTLVAIALAMVAVGAAPALAMEPEGEGDVLIPNAAAPMAPTAKAGVPAAPLNRNAYVRVPILMYHHLEYLKPNASHVWQVLSVSPASFEQQVAYLATHNFHTIYFSDLVAHLRYGRPLPPNPIILTFDDAWRDDYFVAYPILRKYGIVGTFFPPTGYLNHYAFSLTWAQIYEMNHAGMEFGSHTVDHPFLTRQTPAQVWHELVDSKWLLQTRLGKPVSVFAYPFGAYNNLVVAEVAQAGYTAAVTTNAGAYQYAAGLLTLHRITIPYWFNLAAFAATVWR
jgi:peptidoglycan/xylan/chitin deacetylase (PgdA/CDA1 family)